jgi:hypothetical protein
MAQIQRFVRIAAGQTVASGTVTLGSFDERNPQEQHKLRKVHVAPVQPYGTPYTCLVTIPGGTVIGPIDVPFTMNLPLPASFVVSGTNAGASEQIVMLTADDLPDAHHLDDATYLVIDEVDGGPAVAIPDAVVAVSVLSIGTQVKFLAYDSSDICTLAAAYRIPRPRAAKYLNNPAEGGNYYLFHY